MSRKVKYPVIDGKKECGSCGKMLPVSIYPKARNHYQSSCPTCKAAWAKEYRQRPNIKESMAEYHKEYMKTDANRLRANALMRGYTKTDKYKTRRNANRKEWAAAQKLEAIAYKGGECAICGYSKCSAALDFHHINPEEKDGYGTGALKAHWSFEKNLPELDKCVLLCARCHREVHAGEAVL